ncbi:MAG TPA: dihydrolipoyl dehydrogenase [Terriglobales bacterium]|nr:dihydrolipoyl dehydrogenase [Terriglobales bacterium]
MADLNKEFDLVVIGSGPGGYWAAIRAGEYGLSTLCIEKDPKLGGTCLHVGCIPTKALLHNADVMDTFRNAKELGVDVGAFSLNWAQVQARKDKIVSKHAKGIEFLYRKNKVEWLQGQATWAGPGRLEVATSQGRQTVRAKNIIIATGSAARMLPGLTPDDRILTNIEILKLDALPKRLVIIGAGAVGVEFASIFKRFGTEVTMLEALPRLVPIEDEEISKELEKAFRKQKIEIQTGAKVEKVERTAAGVKVNYTTADGKPQVAEADKVLVAVGRRPVTEGMNLEKTRIQTERGFIKTDAFMRTGEPNVYAIGDVVFGTPQLAHVASMEGMVAVAHIAGRPVDPIDYLKIPNVTFCEPQVASVGLTERAARDRGLRYKVGKFPFVGNSKATILGSHEGFIKMLADQDDGTVLGVHMIGPMVTELISEAVLGMQLNVAADELMETVHAHPTLYEAVLDAANSVYGLTINA